MSWDIFVQDWPTNARTVDEIPDEYVPAAVGKRSAIIERIKQVVPFAVFDDPAWGHIRGDGFSIEINLGRDEEVMGFAFHVRGGDPAVGIIADILDHLGLRAVEGGHFFDRNQAVDSLRHWRSYRDQVLGSSSPDSES